MKDGQKKSKIEGERERGEGEDYKAMEGELSLEQQWCTLKWTPGILLKSLIVV